MTLQVEGHCVPLFTGPSYTPLFLFLNYVNICTWGGRAVHMNIFWRVEMKASSPCELTDTGAENQTGPLQEQNALLIAELSPGPSPFYLFNG